MKVNVDQKAGFCFGVVQAIKKAEDYLQKEKSLFCLGQIVHNEAEANRLEKLGLKSITHDEFKELKNEIVLIRAHGEPPSTYEIAKKNNLTLIDATCPLVIRLQKKIRTAAEKLSPEDKIVIYGNAQHPEVVGLSGQAPEKTIIINDKTEINTLPIKGKVHLYSQTTKDKNKYEEIKNDIEKQSGRAVEYNDSICRQVYNRKDELSKFATRHDVMIFVGGSRSSNAKVLFNICLQANAHSFFISDVHQLQKDWFSPDKTVGISGATSTPPWQMEEVAAAIRAIYDEMKR